MWDADNLGAVSVAGPVAVCHSKTNTCAAVAGSPTMRSGRHLITFTILRTLLGTGVINVGIIDATKSYRSDGGTALAFDAATGSMWLFVNPHSKHGIRQRVVVDAFPIGGIPDGSHIALLVDLEVGNLSVFIGLAAGEDSHRTSCDWKASFIFPIRLPASVRPFARLFEKGDVVRVRHQRLTPNMEFTVP